ncbi:MAG: SH3 domain-containing protein [Bacteroidales bacterium]|nr:SH3 domain-containing protein [Bacteroidales bacterium]
MRKYKSLIMFFLMLLLFLLPNYTTLAESNMRDGDSGEHVREMKQKLVDMGFVNWNPPTPYYGSVTADYVSRFQSYYGLQETGEVDSETLQKMDEILNPPYRDGDRGIPIKNLKNDLVTLGFASWSNPSIYYGVNTMSVVKSFQTAFGLTADGIAGQETLNLIQELKNGNVPYVIGDSGQHVVEMKQKLVDMGFVSWNPPSPYYGDITARYVSNFQSYYGLPNTGIADEITRKKMDEVLNPPFKDSDRGNPVRDLKKDLVDLGFASWSSPSIYYGSNTMQVVKKFQSAFGLVADGIAGQQTIAMIEKIQNGDVEYYIGDSGSHIGEMKQLLVDMGFASWNPPSNAYGKITAGVVEQFQSYYNLPITGYADEHTRQKMIEVTSPPYKAGDRGKIITQWKEKLVTLGFTSWSSPSQFYGSNTAIVVERLQSYYGLNPTGILDTDTMNKIDETLNSPYSIGNHGEHIRDLKRKLVLLDYASWTHPSAAYGEITANVVKAFQRDNNLTVNGIADSVTLALIEKQASEVGLNIVVSNYNVTFDRAVQLQMLYGNPKYDGAGNILSDEANVRYFMNPSNAIEYTPWYLQFMRLDTSTNLTASEINRQFLNNKGTLTNMANAFITAGERYGVNEIYLISHALHETGNGSSTLALGVGVDKKGNIVRDSSGLIIRDKSHPQVDQIVYNMYGYGAHDNDPTGDGVKYAYDKEWFSPEAAIIGGAQQITNNYIERGQNTLFKMKWDPDVAGTNRFGRQYATHVMWAEIQARKIYSMVGDAIFETRTLFDVPQYLNQPGPDRNKPSPPTSPISDDLAVTFPTNTIGRTTGNVNLRSAPSTTHDSHGIVSRNSQVEVLGINDNRPYAWYKVKHNGIEGWIREDYLDLTNLYVIRTVSSSNVNYRSAPSNGVAGNVRGSISRDSLVALSLNNNNQRVVRQGVANNVNYHWVRVYIGNNQYWIADNFLTKY